MRLTTAHFIVASIGLALQWIVTISVNDLVALQSSLEAAVTAVAGSGGGRLSQSHLNVRDTDGDGRVTWLEVGSAIAGEASAAVTEMLKLISKRIGAPTSPTPLPAAAAGGVLGEDHLAPELAVALLESALEKKEYQRAYSAWRRLLEASSSSPRAAELRERTAAQQVAQLSAVLLERVIEGAEGGARDRELADACRGLAVFARTAAAEGALLQALRRGVQPAEPALWALWSRSGYAQVDRMLERGTAQLERGELDLALGTLNGVVAAAPAFAEGYNQRATLKYGAGDYRGALRDCVRVLELSPSHFGALSGAGLVHFALWRVESAWDGRVPAARGRGAAADANGPRRDDSAAGAGVGGGPSWPWDGRAADAMPGVVAMGVGRGELTQALAYFRRALVVHPLLADAQANARAVLGLLQQMGVGAEAEGSGAAEIGGVG